MKIRHLLVIAVVLVVVLFGAHIYMSHGGVNGLKQGLGFGG